jgi:hypothetical protein
MNERLIQQELSALAAHPGVQACALVEGSSGLVWQASGNVAIEPQVWEAAVDHWRLHRRMSQHFEFLGELGAAVMYHQHAMLVVFPCAERIELLVVCIATNRSVNWRAWQEHARVMGERLTQK